MLHFALGADSMGGRGTVVLRWLAVAAIGVASWLLVPRASVPVVALIAGIALVAVFMRQPALGPGTVVAASVAIPFSAGTGTQTSIGAGVLILGLLLALWLAQAVAQGAAPVRVAKPVLPLALLLVCALLAFLAGNQPWIVFANVAPIRAQAGGLAIFVLSAGAFGLAAYRTPSIRWLQVTTLTFFVLGGVYVIGRSIGVPGVERVMGGASGSIFWVWLSAMAFGQALSNRSLAWTWRLLSLIVSGMAFLSPFITSRDWLSGWFPALVALCATLVVASPRLAIPLALLGSGVAAAAIPFVVASVTGGDNEYSLMTRLEAWRVLWQVFEISPIIGTGPANYYWYTPLFPLLGYYVVFVSHNQYIDLLLQTGLLGTGCFLWFIAACWLLGWRLRTRASEGFARAYVHGALGGLVGTAAAMMLGDWFLPFVYNIGYAGMRASLLGWIFLGGLVAIERLCVPTASPSTGVSGYRSGLARRVPAPSSSCVALDGAPESPRDGSPAHRRRVTSAGVPATGDCCSVT